VTAALMTLAHHASPAVVGGILYSFCSTSRLQV
jgi:hypothetical protein